VSIGFRWIWTGWIWAGLLFLAAMTGFAGGPANAGVPGIGAYVWSGYYRDDASAAGFASSAQFVLDQGFTTLRITASPTTVAELHLGAACASNPQIACILNQQLAGAAFSDRRLRLLILTIADFAASGHYTDPVFIAANRARIAAEYTAALAFLDKRLAGMSVDVVLTNWEGDNMVYCGAAYSYATSPSFRVACPGIKSRLDGFMAWSELRRGIVESYQAGSPGLHYHYATEFNVMHMLATECKGVCDPTLDVLHRLAVLPARPALCSYSAWDSFNRGLLAADLDPIRAVCDQVIIGELGFAATGSANAVAQQGFADAGAAIARNASWIPATILWNAFEVPETVNKGYGLWTVSGAARNLTLLPAALRP